MKPKRILLIRHGESEGIRLFLMRWFHYTVEEFERLANLENCAIVSLELQENGRYRLMTEMRTREVVHAWRLEA